MKKEAQSFMKKLKKNNLELTSEEQSKQFDVIDELDHMGYIYYVTAKDKNKIALSLTPLGEEYVDRELEKNKWIDKKTLPPILFSAFITYLMIVFVSPSVELQTNNAVLEMTMPAPPIIEKEHQLLIKEEMSDIVEICFRNKGKADSGPVNFTLIKDGLDASYGHIDNLKAGEKQECDFVFLRAKQQCIDNNGCFEELTKNNKATVEVFCPSCNPQKFYFDIGFCVWKNSTDSCG